jgi:hypothetical protein
LNVKKLLAYCLNCGEKGPHYVPPSLGDRGFYLCQPSPELVAKRREESA